MSSGRRSDPPAPLQPPASRRRSPWRGSDAWREACAAFDRKSSAISQPTAAVVEGQERHDQHVRLARAGIRQRLAHAHGRRFERLPRRPGAKLQRLPHAHNPRQQKLRAVTDHPCDQRCRVDLARERQERGDGLPWLEPQNGERAHRRSARRGSDVLRLHPGSPLANEGPQPLLGVRQVQQVNRTGPVHWCPTGERCGGATLAVPSRSSLGPAQQVGAI